MSEERRAVDGFPEYEVDDEGNVYTAASGRLRRLSRTQQGAIKVTLFLDGVAYTRSVALMVARAFVYNNHDPEIFDTPIHLNNDLTDNRAVNLAWRPRWFAVKYQKQYWNPEYRHATTKVMDNQTGDVYETLIEPCQKYGFLFVDVLDSCTRNRHVFPTWKTFTFV